MKAPGGGGGSPPAGAPGAGPSPTPPSAPLPGVTPPAVVAPPPGSTPPAGPSGAPVDPSAATDAAGKVVDQVGNARDRIGEARDRVESLTADDDDGDDDEADADEEAASEDEALADDEAAREAVVVDYTRSWEDVPPRQSVVVTRVIHVHPSPPAPAPEEVVEPARVRGFIGASVRGTAINTNPSALSGARAGFTFDDRFTIGGAFYSLTARYGGPIVDSHGNHLGLRMSYAGVLLAWTLYQGRVLHVALESLAGAGAACVSRSTRMVGRRECIEKVGLISLEPGVEVGFRVTDWARVSLAGGYRFVTREAWRPPNDFLLSGPYVGLNVDFGWFGEDR
ncbi:MAG: hypothetical protein H6712_26385 [Myxococcales bacterium]|nr:hypothetical protein [Myxococcales bacterium]